MAQEQIAAIEQDIAKSRAVIDFAATLTRLKANKDFKELVLKGYFETEAVRLVHLKAEPHMQAPESQLSIVSQIDAIGSFSGYLNSVLAKAAMAARTLDDNEQALAEIHIEDANHPDQGAN